MFSEMLVTTEEREHTYRTCKTNVMVINGEEIQIKTWYSVFLLHVAGLKPLMISTAATLDVLRYFSAVQIKPKQITPGLQLSFEPFCKGLCFQFV